MLHLKRGLIIVSLSSIFLQWAVVSACRAFLTRAKPLPLSYHHISWRDIQASLDSVEEKSANRDRVGRCFRRKHEPCAISRTYLKREAVGLRDDSRRIRRRTFSGISFVYRTSNASTPRLIALQSPRGLLSTGFFELL